MKYPKWKYHADGTAVTVNHEFAESQLEGDWRDSPAHFDVVPDIEPEDEDPDETPLLAAAVEKPKRAKKAKE